MYFEISTYSLIFYWNTEESQSSIITISDENGESLSSFASKAKCISY